MNKIIANHYHSIPDHLSPILEDKEYLQSNTNTYNNDLDSSLFDLNAINEINQHNVRKFLTKILLFFTFLFVVSLILLCYCHFSSCNNRVWLITYIIMGVIIIIIATILFTYMCV